jgi:hypothetical protein
LLSLKSFVVEKRHMAMQKLFIKKRKKRIGKKGQVSKICKTMGTPMPAWKKRKKEMNKIAHVFLQSCFQVLKERCYQGVK